jgi:hypothetical protein
MKGSIFVLHRNFTSVSPQVVAHVFANIGKVQHSVDKEFELNHDWAIVI